MIRFNREHAISDRHAFWIANLALHKRNYSVLKEIVSIRYLQQRFCVKNN